MNKIEVKKYLEEVRSELESQFPEIKEMSKDQMYNFFFIEESTTSYSGVVISEGGRFYVRPDFFGIEIPTLDRMGFVRSHQINGGLLD